MAGAAAPLIQTHAADGGLMSCLAIARVKPELVTHMKDVLKMESLQDFFFYVSKEAWEAELDSKVVKLAVEASIITEGMKPIQLARVRMAWQSAAKLQDSASALASSAASSSEDPLPETARQMLEERWKKRYPEFSLDPAIMGASAIIHRLYREWIQGQPSSVVDLQKMRTALAERFQGDKLQIALGDATLTLADYTTSTSRLHFRSMAHFYLMHRTLTNCWAYVGTAEVESKNSPGSQVLLMSYQQALGYSDTILRKSVDVPESAQLAWVVRNDWLTRSRMTGGAKRVADPPQLPDGERPPKKPPQTAGSPSKDLRTRQQTVTTLKGNKALCKAWNDDRCCQRAKEGIAVVSAPSPDPIHPWSLLQSSCLQWRPQMHGSSTILVQLFREFVLSKVRMMLVRWRGALEACKPIAWRGRGELPTFPWSSLGTWPVIDLWGGVGGTLFACLSLGLRVYAVSVEQDPLAAERAARSFPNVVSLQCVEEFRGVMIREFLHRRTVEGVIIGGGCLCQGNSNLNRRRGGLDDSPYQRPKELVRIHDEIINLEEARGLKVRMFLESAASSPREFVRQCNNLMDAKPVLVRAAQFGWVHRDRLFWLGSYSDFSHVCLPLGVSLAESEKSWAIDVSLSKPIPASINLERGFSLHIDPKANLTDASLPRIFTFTAEFSHPLDKDCAASAQATARFQEDSRRFPVEAYEDISVAWRQGQWRTLTPSERAAIH
ncbi:unnamed protein product, partial [Symbiodinium sp. CCMP2456]